jgi:hypothetical protein
MSAAPDWGTSSPAAELVSPMRRLAPDGLERGSMWSSAATRIRRQDRAHGVRGRGDETVAEGQGAGLDGRR